MSRILVESTMLSGLKFASAPDAAKLLHFAALCYAAENLTDGFISESAARHLTKARPEQFAKAIAHLSSVQPGCSSPSWECREGGWFLHDYDDPLYDNPMKAHLDKRREQKSKAGTEGGRKSAEARAKKYGTARPLNSAREADPEAATSTPNEAGASDGASNDKASKAGSAHEADVKLARAGAHAQPLPSLPFPSPPTTHGDTGLQATNGAASTLAAGPSPQVQVVRLLDWFLAKRGWSSWLSSDVQKREAQLAINIVELGFPFADLIASLEVMWSATDPDDRPSSLGYFWTRLQDEQHASTKQRRSHVRTDAEPTRLELSLKPGGSHKEVSE